MTWTNINYKKIYLQGKLKFLYLKVFRTAFFQKQKHLLLYTELCDLEPYKRHNKNTIYIPNYTSIMLSDVSAVKKKKDKLNKIKLFFIELPISLGMESIWLKK